MVTFVLVSVANICIYFVVIQIFRGYILKYDKNIFDTPYFYGGIGLKFELRILRDFEKTVKGRKPIPRFTSDLFVKKAES